MSYIGSDDIPLCDLCEVMCPPSFGDGFIAPWPPSGRRWENGRAPEVAPVGDREWRVILARSRRILLCCLDCWSLAWVDVDYVDEEEPMAPPPPG